MTRRLQRYVVFGFPSTHDAISAESALKSAGIAVTAIPRPVSVGGADCGIAMRVAPADDERARHVLTECSIPIAVSAEIDDL